MIKKSLFVWELVYAHIYAFCIKRTSHESKLSAHHSSQFSFHFTDQAQNQFLVLSNLSQPKQFRC